MIAAVIATRYEPPELARLLDVLASDDVRTVVIHDEPKHEPDWSLYRLWNRGVRRAIGLGAEYLAVLNDDIHIRPGTFHIMARHLSRFPEVGVVYPDVRGAYPFDNGWFDRRHDDFAHTDTRGTWGAGGMTGFCFMFRADLQIPFDEQYQLWYGDDAFEEAVRAKGLLVARIDGLPIDHSPGQSTARLPAADVQRMIEHDRHRWDTRQRVIVQHEMATVTG